jgi:hypothetical protein
MEEKNNLQSIFYDHYLKILVGIIILALALILSICNNTATVSDWKQKLAEETATHEEVVASLEEDISSLESDIKNKDTRIEKLSAYQSTARLGSWKEKAEFYNKYIVVTTPTGECYHEFDCSYVNRFYIETFTSARNDGYRPCSRCNPDAREGITYDVAADSLDDEIQKYFGD